MTVEPNVCCSALPGKRAREIATLLSLHGRAKKKTASAQLSAGEPFSRSEIVHERASGPDQSVTIQRETIVAL
jgi:hypothetical protein